MDPTYELFILSPTIVHCAEIQNEVLEVCDISDIEAY
jgi:hypothetical protein